MDGAGLPAAIAPAAVALERMDPALAAAAELDPADAALVARATERRRREFAAGRLCVRRALQRLEISGAPLIARTDRSPAWPPGIVGSISHTEGLCVAAVARERDVMAIGLDVEPAHALPPEVWDLVLTAAERASISELPARERGIRARLLFSAKEAFYKCHHSGGGGWLDFHDVEIMPASSADIFEVAAPGARWSSAAQLKGRYAITPRFIVAAFTATPA